MCQFVVASDCDSFVCLPTAKQNVNSYAWFREAIENICRVIV